MSRKKVEPISKKFVFFLIFMICFSLYYVLKDDKIKKIKKDATFQEMLEYNYDSYTVQKPQNFFKNIEEEPTVQRRQRSQSIETPQHNYYQSSVQDELRTTEYNKLLDSLKSSPYKSTFYINVMVNQLLKFKGYPQNIIEVKKADINQSRAKVQGSYLIANFDITTGILNIDESILNKLPVTTVIAVLSHELDHFDKIASICRYMGVDNFEALLNENGIRNVDTSFWRIASTFGATQNFDGEYYKQALERFIEQNKLNSIGAYTHFYRLAENIRNPLEISAYEQSDYVFNHFGITVQNGPTQKLVKEFNDIDWIIYNKIQANNMLKRERIAIFDYLYTNALIEQMPDLKAAYDSCINFRNGDLSTFWGTYKFKMKNFYQNNGQLNLNEFNTIMAALNATKTKANNNISIEDYTNAIANKINTLKSLHLTEQDVEELKFSTENYIKLTEENKIQNPKQYLNCVLILLCIENKLNRSNINDKLSLFYLKFPKSIQKNKKQKQLLIELYNNFSFRAGKPSYRSEQEHLIELINQTRLNVN